MDKTSGIGSASWQGDFKDKDMHPSPGCQGDSSVTNQPSVLHPPWGTDDQLSWRQPRGKRTAGRNANDPLPTQAPILIGESCTQTAKKLIFENVETLLGRLLHVNLEK